MEDMIILCSECGVKNRISQDGGNPKCGNCAKTLHVNAEMPHEKFFNSFKGLINGWTITIAVILGFTYLSDVSSNPQKPRAYTPPQSHTQGPASAPMPVFNAPPVPIEHGIFLIRPQNGVAPLTIQTSPGSNYYVKVVNMYDHAVAAFYIEGGRQFDMDMPLGSYYLKYAAGDVWYGPEYRFGPNTAYSQADSILNFEEEYDGYSGYTIELIMQYNGNMPTHSIDASSF